MNPSVVNQVIETFSSGAQPAMALREAGTQNAGIELEEQHPAFLSTPRRRKPVVWFALAAAVLIVLSIISWIVIRSVNKPGSDGPEAQQPQVVPTEPAKQQEPGPSLPVNDNQTVERRGGSDEPKKKSTNDQTQRQPEQQPTPATFAAVTIFPGGTSRGTTDQSGNHQIRTDRDKSKTAFAYHEKLREISPRAPQRAKPNSRSDSRFKAR